MTNVRCRTITTPEDYKTLKIADVYTPQDPDEGDSICLGKHTQFEADLQQLHNDLAEMQQILMDKKVSQYQIAKYIEEALADIEEINWRSGGNTAMFNERCEYCRHPIGGTALSTGERYSASPTGLVCRC